MTILFLDFDGVLHPEFCHSSKYFSCLPHLEAAVRQVPGCEIVISSTWRIGHSLPRMLRPFSPDIVQRVIGITPIAIEMGTLPDTLNSFRREAECEAWLRMSGLVYAPWVALDDRPWLFTPFCKHVYRVNGKTGLTAKDIEPLVRRLRGVN